MSCSQAYSIEIEMKAEDLKRKSHEFKTSQHQQHEVECDVSQKKLSQLDIENPHSIYQCRDVPNMYKQETTSEHEECTTQYSHSQHNTLCNGNMKQTGVQIFEEHNNSNNMADVQDPNSIYECTNVPDMFKQQNSNVKRAAMKTINLKYADFEMKTQVKRKRSQEIPEKQNINEYFIPHNRSKHKPPEMFKNNNITEERRSNSQERKIVPDKLERSYIL